MYTLAIDTASSHTTVAVLRDQRVVAASTWPAANKEASMLLPEIEKLLQEQGLDHKNLCEIFVVKGPGSFTGLRVGVTVANTMAYLLKIPVYSISTIDLWHANTDLPVLIFAGKLAVYLCIQGEEVAIIPLQDINQKLNDLHITKYTGDLTAEQIEQIKAQYQEPNSADFLRKAYAHFRPNLQAETIVKPLYIKDPAISKSKKPIL